ncbi:hypothetical protein AVEN_185475-1 [Araneus ventricosus]|uniref:Uncharacterized protein n=1 Tax=Araneus ventricosus TaxID=182803 RepID=A0A4Y2HDJ7_ARAVE|nr:hypothetical protein AVEN_185475-1 [Araneus ventricosus]
MNNGIAASNEPACVDIMYIDKAKANGVCLVMKPRHLNCLAHFGDPPDGSIDVRESVYMYIYKEKIVREHLAGPQHYPDNGLVSGTRGEVSRNQGLPHHKRALSTV